VIAVVGRSPWPRLKYKIRHDMLNFFFATPLVQSVPVGPPKLYDFLQSRREYLDENNLDQHGRREVKEKIVEDVTRS
jgi:hypothetical protein